jgi:hypothetical protein
VQAKTAETRVGRGPALTEVLKEVKRQDLSAASAVIETSPKAGDKPVHLNRPPVVSQTPDAHCSGLCCPYLSGNPLYGSADIPDTVPTTGETARTAGRIARADGGREADTS